MFNILKGLHIIYMKKSKKVFHLKYSVEPHVKY